MNEVETYLRQSGNWRSPVTTDWRGHAISGPWWPTYYSEWLDAHGAEREQRPDFGPGTWARDAAGKEWWITDTPDWDWRWFEDQHVRPPERVGENVLTYLKDYGGGLYGVSYDAPSDKAVADASLAKAYAAVAIIFAIIAVLASLLVLL